MCRKPAEDPLIVLGGPDQARLLASDDVSADDILAMIIAGKKPAHLDI